MGCEGVTSPRWRRLIGMSVCPSPKGEGMVLSPFLCDGVVEFPTQYQVNVWFQEQLAFPPWGRRERGRAECLMIGGQSLGGKRRNLIFVNVNGR